MGSLVAARFLQGSVQARGLLRESASYKREAMANASKPEDRLRESSPTQENSFWYCFESVWRAKLPATWPRGSSSRPTARKGRPEPTPRPALQPRFQLQVRYLLDPARINRCSLLSQSKFCFKSSWTLVRRFLQERKLACARAASW